ncbi:MAG: RnfABCDGE type electron transport complex subunit B [Lachnospiraceae bacterium]|nr:RnfABCDGE type electron transport complex subunit B [Lachnospiraceae bacterium]
MEIILITTLVITLIGLLVGAGLVFTGKKFHVDKDEREAAIREVLPGNNCGACGFAGCDAMAEAIAKGNAPVNGCPVGGNPVAEKIAAIMGTDAAAVEKKTAFVHCKGTCEVTKNQGNYIGLKDCRTAFLNGIRTTECDYGCIGLGSCVSVCPEKAISIVNGCAVVNRKKCVGCGLCAKACPKGLIELVPEHQEVIVQCSNRDNGITVKKVCSAGCLGCMLCTRKCESDAIAVVNNLASVKYENCIQCGKCVSACPVKVITGPKAEAAVPAGKKEGSDG